MRRACGIALGASSGRLLREFLMESALLARWAACSARQSPPRVCGASRDHHGPATPRRDGDGRPRRSCSSRPSRSLGAVLSGLPQAWRRTRITAMAGLSVDHEGIDRRPRQPPAPRRHRRRAGGDGRDPDGGFGPAGPQLPAPARRRSGLRSARRARGADLSRQPGQYNTGDRSRTYYRTLFERLAAMPGVISVGGATTVPTSPLGPDFERPVWPEGIAAPDAAKVPASVRDGHARILSNARAPARGRTRDRRSRSRRSPPGDHGQMKRSRLRCGRGSAVGQQLMVDYSTAGTYPYEIVGVRRRRAISRTAQRAAG